MVQELLGGFVPCSRAPASRHGPCAVNVGVFAAAPHPYCTVRLARGCVKKGLIGIKNGWDGGRDRAFFLCCFGQLRPEAMSRCSSGVACQILAPWRLAGWGQSARNWSDRCPVSGHRPDLAVPDTLRPTYLQWIMVITQNLPPSVGNPPARQA